MIHEEKLDLALVTLMKDIAVGEVVRQEQIVWIGADSYVHQEDQPLPLAVYPTPCPHREAMMPSPSKAMPKLPGRFEASCAVDLFSLRQDSRTRRTVARIGERSTPYFHLFA